MVAKGLLCSADEYRRLKRRAREVVPTRDLNETDIRAITLSKMSKRHAHLDDELK